MCAFVVFCLFESTGATDDFRLTHSKPGVTYESTENFSNAVLSFCGLGT